MKFYIYKTTNNINSKIYIGVHKSDDIQNDEYIGSGVALKHAIAKYGTENFSREILYEFDTAEQAYKMESKIVNFDFVNNTSTYNMKEGGKGGFNVPKETLRRTALTTLNELDTCVYCGYVARKCNIKRHHNENCNSLKHVQTREEKIKEINSQITLDTVVRKRMPEKNYMIHLTYPHCGVESKNSAVMYRWHFDNCKTVKPVRKKSISYSKNTILKYKKAALSRPEVTCPYCNKIGRGPSMARWHFDNCKHKTIQL